MARTTHVFVGAEAKLEEVRGVVEATVGAAFEMNRKEEPVVAFGDTNIYLAEGHRFDDEDMQWPDGTWIRLRSDYPFWIEVRDVDRDLDRQVEVARKVFAALKEVGQWRLVLIYDMQRVLDRYEPGDA
jgi:hypothetical protein